MSQKLKRFHRHLKWQNWYDKWPTKYDGILTLIIISESIGG